MKKIILSLIPVLCLSGIIVWSCTEINADNRKNDTNLPSGNAVTDNPELFIDGMYFDRDGFVNSPAKKSNYVVGGTSNTEYYYDDDGRISRTVQTTISESATTIFTNEFEYSYKKIVTTSTMEIDYTDSRLDESKTVSTLVTEYY